MVARSKITGQDVGAVLRESSRRLRGDLANKMLQLGNFAGGQIAKSLSRKVKDSTGRLGASFLPASFIDRGGKVLRVGALSNLAYAAIQNFGGIITPKRAKNLAIPLTKEARIRSPRDWNTLQFIKSKKGNKLLAEVRGKRIKPQYALKDQVTLKGKRYIEAAEVKVKERIAKEIPGAIKMVITRAKQKVSKAK